MELDVFVTTKVRTIYYETKENEILKYHFPSDSALSLANAEQVLKDNNIDFHVVLRVITEKTELQLTREQFDKAIIDSERYYKN